MTEGMPIWVGALIADTSALNDFYENLNDKVTKLSAELVELAQSGEFNKATAVAGEITAFKRLLSNVRSYEREAQQQAVFSQTQKGG